MDLLNKQQDDGTSAKPIVIPSGISNVGVKKILEEVKEDDDNEELVDISSIGEEQIAVTETISTLNDDDVVVDAPIISAQPEPVKKGRGRHLLLLLLIFFLHLHC